MSSYIDFFYKNVINNKTECLENIRGTCYSMCPQSEEELRVRENMVHVLEALGTGRKLVKSYSRSAADSNMAVPRRLRPYPVLRDTVRYLLTEVIKRQDVPLLVLYDFVNDRLRAVRQDMTIQRLPPEECASLLEPMIRFYVYFGYRLRNHSISDFDPVLNKKYLLESLKWFLYCCDTMEKTVENKAVEKLNMFMSKMNIGENRLRFDRALMESVYILCNLEDIYPLLRYLELPKELKMNPKVELAYKIAIANLKGNFVAVTRQIEKLCPLAYFAFCSYLPIIQRRALLVLSHAYSSKQLSVSRAALQRWLRLGGEAQAQAACRHYGLKAHGDAVQFSKAEFDTEAPLHQLAVGIHWSAQEEFNKNIEDIFVICN